MARIRYLKPDFFLDDDLADLPYQHRIAYAGLWCHADREGRLEDAPRKLKHQILPYDDVDFEEILNDLTKKPFIIRYVSGEKNYIQIISFLIHQKPHHTERASIIPPPEKRKESNKEKKKEKGMGNGKEKYEQSNLEESNGSLTVKTRFIPPTIEQLRQYCTERGNDISPEGFFNFYESKNWMIGKNKMTNWKAAVRTWEQKRKEQRNGKNADSATARSIRNAQAWAEGQEIPHREETRKEPF